MSRSAVILNKFGKPFCGWCQVVSVYPSLHRAQEMANTLNRQSIAKHVGPFTAAEIEELKMVKT